MDEFDYSNYLNYSYPYDNYTNPPIYEDEDEIPNNATCFEEVPCVTLLVANVIILLLGVSGNGLVIWIAGFKMKRTVNTTWYLSLAISDFLFCACLPITITSSLTSNWIFGLFMCKFTSFVMFLNMFSSIYLLVIISVDRCVSVMFPVWAQNQRTNRKASVAVVLAWVISVALSVPSIIFRDTRTFLGKTICLNIYPDHRSQKILAASRFVSGFMVPLLFILISYSVIILRLRYNRMTRSSKPFRVMTALIVTFFVSWLPYHVFVLLELNHHLHNAGDLTIGLQVGTAVATANSCLNPLLYVFMGNDFKQMFRSTVLSKMENAMGDEGRTISRYLSRSSSVEGKASTHI